jgi:hypothetical protein
MRSFSLLIRKSAGLSAPSTPARRACNAGRPRRRLDDLLADIFARAIAANEIEEAADLLLVLEKWHQSRKTHLGRGRRVDGTELKAMRADLDRLTAPRSS